MDIFDARIGKNEGDDTVTEVVGRGVTSSLKMEMTFCFALVMKNYIYAREKNASRSNLGQLCCCKMGPCPS